MQVCVTDNGIQIDMDWLELACLHKAAKARSGKARPTRADMRKSILAAVDSFCSKGCGYPQPSKRRRSHKA